MSDVIPYECYTSVIHRQRLALRLVLRNVTILWRTILEQPKVASISQDSFCRHLQILLVATDFGALDHLVVQHQTQPRKSHPCTTGVRRIPLIYPCRLKSTPA